MSAATLEHADWILSRDVLAHLDQQLVAARRLLKVVLEQGAAIRRQDVENVVRLAGLLQVEVQMRRQLDQARSGLLQRAGARLGVDPSAVSLTLLERLMDPESADAARVRSSELRGLLEELQREHTVNRALMTQELAFLDHLLRLADSDADAGYDAAGDRRASAPVALNGRRRVFEAEA